MKNSMEFLQWRNEFTALRDSARREKKCEFNSSSSRRFVSQLFHFALPAFHRAVLCRRVSVLFANIRYHVAGYIQRMMRSLARFIRNVHRVLAVIEIATLTEAVPTSKVARHGNFHLSARGTSCFRLLLLIIIRSEARFPWPLVIIPFPVTIISIVVTLFFWKFRVSPAGGRDPIPPRCLDFPFEVVKPMRWENGE